MMRQVTPKTARLRRLTVIASPSPFLVCIMHINALTKIVLCYLDSWLLLKVSEIVPEELIASASEEAVLS